MLKKILCLIAFTLILSAFNVKAQDRAKKTKDVNSENNQVDLELESIQIELIKKLKSVISSK